MTINEREVILPRGRKVPFGPPQVRVCGPTDIDRLSKEHWREFHDHDPQFNAECLQQATCIQPFDGATAIGYLFMYRLPSPYEPMIVGLIDQYYLRPVYRHCGVGREMFQLAEKVAHHWGARKVTASYNLRQKHAEFFKSMGYDETHVIVAKEL